LASGSTHRLVNGEDARGEAKRLVLAHWRSGRDDVSDAFNKPLRYPRAPVV
jgi:hypothetical protein